MNKILKTGITYITTLLLMFSLGTANAALVNYVITGDVWAGNELGDPNAFGLADGDTITATGTFDDSVLTLGSGTIDFFSGNGNTMTINVGTETFTAMNDVSYGISNGSSLVFDNFLLTDFDFLATLGTNGASATFSSFFLTFDDQDLMAGNWRAEVAISPVPLPAAVWLFGSGLLGLAGLARRKA